MLLYFFFLYIPWIESSGSIEERLLLSSGTEEAYTRNTISLFFYVPKIGMELINPFFPTSRSKSHWDAVVTIPIVNISAVAASNE